MGGVVLARGWTPRLKDDMILRSLGSHLACDAVVRGLGGGPTPSVPALFGINTVSGASYGTVKGTVRARAILDFVASIL